MLSITKRFEFCYGHCLPNHEGLCKNKHGHNAILEVEITGPLHSKGPASGMILDFGELKRIVMIIVDRLDHQWLNNLIENPTAELIVDFITMKLDMFCDSSGVELLRVRLYETPDSYAEWRRG